ncbi:MAG: O-antigen ligase family protein [Patescibacteria group bacterium]
MNYRLGAPNIIAWKEVALLILACVALWNVVTKKTKIKLDLTTWLILAYLALGVLSPVFHNYEYGLKQWIYGMRFDYAFLITFLIFRHLVFSEEEKNRLIKTLIISGTLSVVYGILSFLTLLIVDPSILTNLGFRNDWSTFRPGEALAFCQKIENQNLCRLQSTFSGPNQYGMFLAVFSGVLLYARGMNTRFRIVATALTLISLPLTFSRTAIIGLATAVVFTFKKTFKYAAIAVCCVAMVAITALAIEPLRNIIIRPASTGGHLANMKLAVERIVEHPFGMGLASAGPANSYFSEPGRAFHPENWYLQVGVELGWIGMSVFIAIILTMIKELFATVRREPENLIAKIGLFGLIAISTGALFLHSFEDSATTILLFALLGQDFGFGPLLRKSMAL